MCAGDDIEIVKEVSDIGSGGQVRAFISVYGEPLARYVLAHAVLQCVMTEGAFAQLVPLLDTFQPR